MDSIRTLTFTLFVALALAACGGGWITDAAAPIADKSIRLTRLENGGTVTTTLIPNEPGTAPGNVGKPFLDISEGTLVVAGQVSGTNGIFIFQ